MDIVVLCGGLSAERDVSISSGTQVAQALRTLGHRVVLIDAYFGYLAPYDDPKEIFAKPYDAVKATVGEREPDLEAVKRSRKDGGDCAIGANLIQVCQAADIVFMAMHGEDGENGRMQALFDVMGIRYTGTGYLSSAVAMNKGITKSLFATAGIPTPPGITIEKAHQPYANVGFPCVVKPCSGGSSVGTSIVHTQAEYQTALELAFQFEDEVVVEKYIKGRELTVGILGGNPTPIVEIIPKTGFYDYKNKYQAGCTEELCPAPLDAATTAQIQHLAVQAAQALLIDTYCRVDFLMDADGIYCLEANTLPGMTPTSLIPRMAGAMGLDFAQVCQRILDESMKKYQ